MAFIILGLLLVVTGIVAWWVVARNSIPEDRSLIAGTPCGPPCWYGIVPDSSTQEVLDQFLGQKHSLVGECQKYDHQAVGGYAGILCDRVEFVIEGDVVKRTIVRPLYSLVLEDVVNKYGPPEFVRAGFQSGPTVTRQAIDLYYASQGFSLHTTKESPFTFVLSEDTKVDIVSYFSPAHFQKIPFLDPKTINEARPWHGYGVYECAGVECPD